MQVIEPINMINGGKIIGEMQRISNVLTQEGEDNLNKRVFI